MYPPDRTLANPSGSLRDPVQPARPYLHRIGRTSASTTSPFEKIRKGCLPPIRRASTTVPKKLGRGTALSSRSREFNFTVSFPKKFVSPGAQIGPRNRPALPGPSGSGPPYSRPANRRRPMLRRWPTHIARRAGRPARWYRRLRERLAGCGWRARRHGGGATGHLTRTRSRTL